MTTYETRQAAVNLHDNWTADNKGCKFFMDYIVENAPNREVEDKAAEMLHGGSFK